VIIDIVCGVMRAAPMPCRARNAMSQPISGVLPSSPENPHRNENTVKTTSPATKTAFCPYRSPRRPASSMSVA
jgi:hypothetical protein